MDLKIINKKNVFMCKGNHENAEITKIYGFYSEINTQNIEIIYHKICIIIF